MLNRFDSDIKRLRFESSVSQPCCQRDRVGKGVVFTTTLIA